MKKSLLTIFLLSSLFSYSQTEIVFEYDEAGNQIYRGTQNTNTTNNPTQPNTPNVISSAGKTPEEIEFWKGITYGPNDVVDDLFITLSQKAKNEISKMEIYNIAMPTQALYSQRFTTSTPLNFSINMRSYLIGNYLLTFYLKNGKIYSETILKR